MRNDSTAQAPGLEPIEDVSIYPFMPNFLQPVVTPPGGITGELVLLDEVTLNTRRSFDGCIGLIDSLEERVPREYLFDWTRYANLGMEALLVSHSEGLKEAPWVKFSPSRGTWAMVSSVPINYVRLAATEGIFRYIGETIRLRVRVDFRRVNNVSLFGVLKAPEPSKEAILFTVPYDTPSILPDRAPGVLSALAPVVQLRLLEGLLPYEETRRRDIIFASLGSSALAEGGHNNLLRVIGKKNQDFQPERTLQLGKFDPDRDRIVGTTMDAGDRRQVYLEERWEENERQRYRVGRILKLFEVEGFAADSVSTRKVLKGLDGDIRDLAEEQFKYVVKTRAFELSGPLMEAKVAIERERGLEVAGSEALRGYLHAKQVYDEALAATGYRMTNLLKTKPETVARYDLRNRFLERIKELLLHHDRHRREMEQEVVLLNLFSQYQRIGLFSIRLAPAPPDSNGETEIVSSESGAAYSQSSVNTITRLMNRAKRRLDIGEALEVPPPGEWQDRTVGRHIGLNVSRQAPRIWGNIGYPTIFIYNFERKKSYSYYASPVDLPFMHELGTLSNTFKVIGESLLSLAHGNGSFEPTQIWHGHQGRDFGGRVLAAQIGQSIVPNYTVKDALVACRSRPDSNMWGLSRLLPPSHPHVRRLWTLRSIEKLQRFSCILECGERWGHNRSARRKDRSRWFHIPYKRRRGCEPTGLQVDQGSVVAGAGSDPRPFPGLPHDPSGPDQSADPQGVYGRQDDPDPGAGTSGPILPLREHRACGHLSGTGPTLLRGVAVRGSRARTRQGHTRLHDKRR